MKFVAFLAFILFIGVASATENVPAPCKPVSVQGESVMLSTKKPLLVMINNLSKTDLWVTHPVSDPNASAGWSSRLQTGNWSALVLDKDAFELSCIESKPGHEQQVPCAGVISVCFWPDVSLPAQVTGTFWAGEDMTFSNLRTHLGGRGFVLPSL